MHLGQRSKNMMCSLRLFACLSVWVSVCLSVRTCARVCLRMPMNFNLWSVTKYAYWVLTFGMCIPWFKPTFRYHLTLIPWPFDLHPIRSFLLGSNSFLQMGRMNSYSTNSTYLKRVRFKSLNYTLYETIISKCVLEKLFWSIPTFPVRQSPHVVPVSKKCHCNPTCRTYCGEGARDTRML